MRTKKDLIYFWVAMVAALSLVQITSCTPPGPPCGDLVVNSVMMTDRTGNNFHYSVEFKNVGAGSVLIDGNGGGPYFQTYLSTDAVLDNLDPAVSGYVLSQGPSPSLASGETLSRIGFYGTPNPISINDYPYLIVVLHTTANTNDCNQSNNTFATRWYDPSCGDLTINSVVMTDRTGNNFHYSVEFKNTGIGSILIDGGAGGPYFQTYLSSNAVLDNLDPPVSGYVLSQGPSPIFSSGQTFSRIGFYGTPNPLPIDNYPYLIVVLHTSNNTNDCNQSDNVFITQWTTPLAICTNCLAQ